MNERLQWGIIGTGLIAKEFADGVRESSTGALLAVGSRAQATADQFGESYGVPRRYSSYEALLADPNVQAVYISTPHPLHAEWTIKAAEAGKHVLVEKPIGLNAAEVMAMIEAARVHDVFLMEAFMYHCHPQMKRLVELIQSGAVGEVKLIRASFGYRAPFDPASRFHNNDLGGGGILDVGCYPVSAARLIAGAACGQPFAEPIEVKACGHLGPTGVDEYAAAVLRFPGDLLAEVSSAIGLSLPDTQTIEIFGLDGKLTVPNPWIPSRWDRQPVPLILKRHDEKTAQTILVEAPLDLYTYEADEVAHHLAHRQAPAMSWDDSLCNMRALDRWRAEIGLVYDREKPERAARTLTGRPLRRSATPAMRYGRLPGLDKPVSRLVFGCDTNHTMPDTCVMLDDYFERGGNAFDTSCGYGIPNGACERNLGWWIKHRGVRDDVVVFEKGGNHPNDYPAGLTKELLGGLERLQLDRVDVYLLHRDNERVPIGEWVEVLNEHWRKGRMKLFGLSNFSIARLQAFDEYARKRGLQSFGLVSNQFSLAQVLASIWDFHLVSSSDAASRAWFTRMQTPLVPWSSQARGFFTDRAARTKRDNPELVRCWYSEENFRCKDRAEQLARQLGVHPINVALAYVLCQPFPTFPIIGPKQISETRSSLTALDILLTPEQLRWLNLETDKSP